MDLLLLQRHQDKWNQLHVGPVGDCSCSMVLVATPLDISVRAAKLASHTQADWSVAASRLQAIASTVHQVRSTDITVAAIMHNTLPSRPTCQGLDAWFIGSRK